MLALLCCAFFLALILKFIKHFASKTFEACQKYIFLKLRLTISIDIREIVASSLNKYFKPALAVELLAADTFKNPSLSLSTYLQFAIYLIRRCCLNLK